MIDMNYSTNQINATDAATSTDTIERQLHHAALLAALHAGYRRAQAAQRAVLVSYSQTITPRDLLSLFASNEKLVEDTAFYWEHPTDGRAIAGFGATATITAEGVVEASEQWRQMIEQTIIRHAPAADYDNHAGNVDNAYPAALTGPLCFGGFAFDIGTLRRAEWDGFPTGLLVLPHLLFGSDGKNCYLTINALIRTEDDIAHQMVWLREALVQLEQAQAVEQMALPSHLETHDLQPRNTWHQMVENATEAIQHGAYSKVVLARSVTAQAATPFIVSVSLSELRARYANAYIFALRRGPRTFLGATPERLARVSNGRVETMALASTAPRGATPAEDMALSEALQRQGKSHNEHHIVVEMICEALAPLTTALKTPEQPRLLKLSNVQHLLTPIVGELLPGVTALDVVATLHPTPAVAGAPREPAIAAIRQSEQFDRGWYAGPIGWIAADGSGEFSVALRSALVEGNSATLFAGCGIVAGSDPQAEYEESGWKLQVMLQSLAGRPHGRGQ